MFYTVWKRQKTWNIGLKWVKQFSDENETPQLTFTCNVILVLLFFVNFKHISHLFLVFLLLTLNK